MKTTIDTAPMKPFRDGQQAFHDGHPLGDNPWIAYDQEQQQIAWAHGWRIARELKRIARWRAWQEKYRDELQIMHREHRKDYRRTKAKPPGFDEFCELLFNREGRAIVAAFATGWQRELKKQARTTK